MKKMIQMWQEAANNKLANGIEAFFTFFDGGKDINHAFERARDNFTRMILPYAMQHFSGRLSDKVSLDIGYGSGGQVLSATDHFKKAMGVDIHDERYVVMEELNRRGAKGKFDLLKTNGNSLDEVEDKSVDFVHSWVTFIHFDTIDRVKAYLDEIKRVMTDDGVAVIFFSRLLRSKWVQSKDEFLADIEAEKELDQPYRENIASFVPAVTIKLAAFFMQKLVEDAGFEVVDITGSQDTNGNYHGQYGIVFKNPAPKKIVKKKKTAKKKVAKKKVAKKKLL
jgi:ubiquinone/menaquinone biosynthesis C-methylase UbiE